MNKNNLKRIAVFMSVMSIIKTQLKVNAQEANRLSENINSMNKRQLTIAYGGPSFFKRKIEEKIESLKNKIEENKENKENRENPDRNNSSENISVINNNSSENKNTQSLSVENNFQNEDNSVDLIIIEQK